MFIACSEIIWLRGLLEELGFPQTTSTPLYANNTNTIQIVTNPIFYERTKHIESILTGGTGLHGEKHGLKMVAVNDNAKSSSKAEDEMENNQTLQKDKNDCLMVSDTFRKVTNSSTPILLERGAFAAGNLSLEPVIPAEDLSMVMKHFGLDCQDENGKHLPAGTSFCSARPWDIIYYRRLKKGSISTEKYARRVDQNREFGIVTSILEAEVVGENYNKNLSYDCILEVDFELGRSCGEVFVEPDLLCPEVKVDPNKEFTFTERKVELSGYCHVRNAQSPVHQSVCFQSTIGVKT
ncbi:hypothetical protein NC652_036474 [Populus alba x Populus x berolinensis]|nr:hypothetical protein NC652_036474 [Populus alba x Populus x berolinensis]